MAKKIFYQALGCILFLSFLAWWAGMRSQSALRTSAAKPGAAANPLLKEASASDLKALFPGHSLTLVNAWASWCHPCKQEFPTLLKIRDKFGPQGLQLLFLSIDQGAERSEAESFLKEQKVGFLTYIALPPATDLLTALDPKWEGAVPSSLVFDETGTLIDSWQGEMTYDEFEAKIAARLNGLKKTM